MTFITLMPYDTYDTVTGRQHMTLYHEKNFTNKTTYMYILAIVHNTIDAVQLLV